jgi:hypothetical protein
MLRLQTAIEMASVPLKIHSSFARPQPTRLSNAGQQRLHSEVPLQFALWYGPAMLPQQFAADFEQFIAGVCECLSALGEPPEGVSLWSGNANLMPLSIGEHKLMRGRMDRVRSGRQL